MSKETTIGDRIKQQREKIGFSMQSLAEVVGVSAWQTVQQWENNSSAPARKRLGAVAEALGVTAEYLMFGDDRVDGRVAPMADEATLRDRFAFAALPSVISMAFSQNKEIEDSDGQWGCALISEQAYKIADAMLVERAK